MVPRSLSRWLGDMRRVMACASRSFSRRTLLMVLLVACARVGYANPSSRAGQGGPGDLEVVMGRVQDSALVSVSQESPSTLLPLLQPDGSFSDLPYGEDGSESFMSHGRRQGALMYHLLLGEDLAQQVVSTFTYITYDAPPNTDSGWWGHVIGTPYRMWEGVVLARQLLPQDLLLDFLDRYWVNTLAGAVWNPDDHTESMAGGNLGPRAVYAEVEALLRGTTHLQVHAQVSQALYRELAQRQPWQDAGLRPDGCLHQHNIKGDHNTENGFLNHTLWTIYNGNYGKVMLKDMSMLLTWFAGTGLDFQEATVEGMFSAYLECQQWLFRGHTMEPTTTGRKLTNGKMVTKWSTLAGVLETGQQLQQLGRHLEEVEAVLHRYDHPRPLPQYALQGHRYFFNSDLTVHQRRDYMASLRLLSNRTARQETWTSGANIDGFFQADGFLTVLVDGGEYGAPGLEVFLVYDWAHVPGVTNLYTTHIPQYQSNPYWSERFFNDAKFVGGATDGVVGVASMVYQRPHVSLTCLKSWFFLDDLILVLASNITLDDQDQATNHSVVTTLAQVAFDGEYVVGREDGGEASFGVGSLEEEQRPAWLHHRSVGYVFLAGDEELHVSAHSRPYNSRNIDVFTAWLDHGPAPEGAALAYVVLPAADLATTRAFASHPDVEVVSQTTQQHVVCHDPSKTVGAVLVSGAEVVTTCGGAGSLQLWVDVPCLLLLTLTSYTPDQAHLTLTLADPQQIYDFLTFRLQLGGRQLEQLVHLPQPPLRGSSLTLPLTL